MAINPSDKRRLARVVRRVESTIHNAVSKRPRNAVHHAKWTRDPAIIQVKNMTGAARPRGTTVQLFAPLLEEMDPNKPWFEGKLPNVHFGNNFAVLKKDAAKDELVEAYIDGFCLARVSVTNITHTHARITTNGWTFVSDTSGPAEIKSTLTTTGVQDLWVQLHPLNPATGFAKATQRWTGASAINCNPCTSLSGLSTNTAITIQVQLPRPNGQDPSIRIGDVLLYSRTAIGDYICISPWSYDAKMNTVRWVSNGFAVIPPGWALMNGTANGAGTGGTGYDLITNNQFVRSASSLNVGATGSLTVGTGAAALNYRQLMPIERIY